MYMEKLRQIIIKIFKVVEKDIQDDMSPETISGWDSLNYLMFISEIEKEFNITFTMEEILNFKNLGDIKAAMRRKGVQNI